MIVITGATGKLGRHVVEGLLKHVPATGIVGLARDPEKASALKALGITVREGDYARPETLQSAFAGADKVLLISSNALGERVAQHGAVVEAVRNAGVRLLAYTGLLRSDTSTLSLAVEHKATEALIRASGIPFVMLRNGWYLENHTEQLGPALAHGVILGAAAEGRFAAASRADYAAAAVAVLTGAGHENKVYELAGDGAYTLTELAAEVSKQSGKPVAYKNLPQADYAGQLVQFGLPAPIASMLADSDAGAAHGELDSTSHDLSTLIGRGTEPLGSAVARAL